jgi:hypothetical protein
MSNEAKQIQITLDATMLDTLMLCPAKFNYRFNLNRISPEKPKALDRGTLIHTGLESYFKALKDKLRYSEAVDIMVQDVRIASAIDSELDPDVSKRVLDVLLEYTEFWRRQDETLTIHAVEAPFMYELYSDEYIALNMIGKIDLLASDNTYTNLPYDHKSYDRDYPAKRFTNQFLNYSYATGSNYLIVDKVGFQTSLKAEQKFKRIPLSFDPLILEQWKQNVVKWAFQYLEMATENSWPMNLTSCDKYNRPCEYFELCDSSGEEARVYKLEANFKIAERWDVSQSLSLKDK